MLVRPNDDAAAPDEDPSTDSLMEFTKLTLNNGES